MELSLFDSAEQPPAESAPLAARLRPSTLQEFVGHQQVFQEILAPVFERGDLKTSFLFWGPPGSGKTTLAHLVAEASGQRVHVLSAVTAGLKELREVFARAEAEPGRHLLFIDEIHRFNKSQQDALLPVVESGRLRLLGATTENPYFELRKALLSRCRVVRLEKLSNEEIAEILTRALKHPDGFGKLQITIEQGCLPALAACADGDARTALNLLELALSRAGYSPSGSLILNEKTLEGVLTDQNLAYHKSSDRRYDLVSAFIKSIRASQPDAALYWLACMLQAGECPRYIFRRLLIAACEDVGLADPSAIAVVSSCAQAFEWVGLPEGKYHLSQATLYLATANKSDSLKALFKAEAHLQRHGPGEVPLHLRDGSYQGASEHGIGTGYENPHRTKKPLKSRYLPEGIHEGSFYIPGNQGYETVIDKRMNRERN
ncbi:MAG: replication-associated recombination protein A [Vulcanimicrobiota bacterium]